MKKLTILLTLAALSAMGAKADLTIGGFQAQVVNGKTCVQIGDVDPGFVYDFSATTDKTVTVTTGFIKDGKIINEAAIVGVDGNKNKLGYFDLSRLDNGYSLIFSTGSAATGDTYDQITIQDNLDRKVDWNAEGNNPIEITAPSDTRFQEGDYIVVHRKSVNSGDGNFKGQLYFKDSDNNDCKYGYADNYPSSDWMKVSHSDNGTGWLNASENRSDFQTVEWYNNDSKAFYFYVDSQVAEILNSDTQVYFNGQGESQDLVIGKIVLMRKHVDTSTDVDACISGLTVDKTTTEFKELADMKTAPVNFGATSGNWGNIDVTSYIKNSGITMENGTELKFTTNSSSGDGQIIVVDKNSDDNFKQDGDYYWHKYADGDTNHTSGGAYEGADCEGLGDNNTYTIKLNEKAAAAVNGVLNSTDEGYKILFCCENSTLLTGFSVGETEVSPESKEGEWKLINLWNAKSDERIPDEGFDAGKWGFTSKNEGFKDYDNNWVTAEGNNTHDIKLVEKFFNSERGLNNRNDWMDNDDYRLTPEYWAVILPRFVASPNDKIIMAIETDKSGVNDDKGNEEKPTMQVWNVQLDADGNFESKILKWGDDPNADDEHKWERYDRTLPINTTDGKRYMTLPLNSTGLSAEDVEVVQNRLRLKGQYFRIHRVDLIHFEEKILEPTTSTESYIIHIKPDALKTHYLWNLANGESSHFLPSQSKEKNHDGLDTSNGANKHAFIEAFELNFNTLAGTSNIDNVGTTTQLDFYVYSAENIQFPIAKYVTTITSGHESTSFKIGDLDISGNACYIDYDDKKNREPRYKPVLGLEDVNFSGQHHITMTVAGTETYKHTCNKDNCNDPTAKTWYRPISNLIKDLETNGIYIKVTTTKTEQPSSKRSRAAARIADDQVVWPAEEENDLLVNYKFKKLPTIGDMDYGDDNILYSFSPKEGNMVPWLVFNRIGMVNNTSVPTGIEGIATEADDNAPTEYYNMSGMRVNGDNLTPGIYIVRKGSKTTKILVR